MKHEEAFYIGYITKTRGLKGEVQLFFEFEAYEDLDLEIVFIEQQGGLVPFFTDQVKFHNNSTAFIFFEDYDHIDKVSKLIKSKVYLSLDKMPERDEESFYLTDLKGFQAIDLNYGDLGLIIEVQEFPQQVIATVLYKEIEVMFPLNDDFITEIDETKKKLYLELPEGLLDIYISE